MWTAILPLGLIVLLGQTPPTEPLPYRSFTSDFERVADSTSGLPMAERVKVFHSHFDKLYPGLYADAVLSVVWVAAEPFVRRSPAGQ
jgi:hypothetical protein